MNLRAALFWIVVGVVSGVLTLYLYEKLTGRRV